MRLFCFQGAWMKYLSLVRGLGYHTELCLFCFGGGGACCGLRLFRSFNGSFGGVEDIVDWWLLNRCLVLALGLGKTFLWECGCLRSQHLNVVDSLNISFLICALLTVKVLFSFFCVLNFTWATSLASRASPIQANRYFLTMWGVVWRILLINESLLNEVVLLAYRRHLDEIVQASLQVDVWIRDPLLLVVKHFY